LIKVYFLSIFSAMDEVSIQTMKNEIFHLVESDPHIEFWFTSCFENAEKALIQIIQETKTLFPKS